MIFGSNQKEGYVKPQRESINRRCTNHMVFRLRVVTNHDFLDLIKKRAIWNYKGNQLNEEV